MELNALYPNKKIECNQIIIKDKKNIYKRVNINDNFDRYYNMMKNNISDEIKQKTYIQMILGKLFLLMLLTFPTYMIIWEDH